MPGVVKYLNVLVIALLLAGSSNKCNEESRLYVPGEVVIKFKPSTSLAIIDSLCIVIGLEEIKKIPQIEVTLYKINSDKSVEEIITKYQKNPHIEFIEPNYKVSSDE